jgi:hypothetical protein
MKLKRNNKAEPKIEYKKASKESKEREEKELEVKSMLDVIEDELEEDGVSLFNNDNVVNEYLILPADITEEDSKELGKYFNAFTQQKMWTRTLIGRLATTVREKKRSLDEVKADIFSGLPAKLSVKEKELRFQTHQEAREVLDEMFNYEEKLNLLTDYLSNLEDGIFNISREISRRSSDWNDDRREDNIGRKRR